jgi:hypothetical protein
MVLNSSLGRIVEEVVVTRLEVLSWYSPGETGIIHRKLLIGYSLSLTRFEPVTSRTQVTSVAAYTSLRLKKTQFNLLKRSGNYLYQIKNLASHSVQVFSEVLAVYIGLYIFKQNEPVDLCNADALCFL